MTPRPRPRPRPYSVPTDPKAARRGLRSAPQTQKGSEPRFEDRERIKEMERYAFQVKRRLENLLASPQQPRTEQDTYILIRVRKAAKALVVDEKERQRLHLQLSRLEDEGHRLGFSQKEIWGMNAVALLIREEKGLERFIESTEEEKES